MPDHTVDLSRDALISICERAVVPHYKWHNRDSCSAQRQLADIYRGLTDGVAYTAHIDGRTIWVEFIRPIERDFGGQFLEVDTYSDYISARDPDDDSEMFYGHGIDFEDDNYVGGYLPTEQRLNEADGDDWY